MNRDNYRPSPLASVSARPTDAGWTLTFRRELAHPPDQVWSALTDPIEISEWAPFNASRNLAEPGDMVLTMVGGAATSDDDIDLPSTVTESEAPLVLEYLWGTERLRWELEPTDAGTLLTLHHTTDQSQNLPKMTAGWHLCLDVMDLFLDGHPIGRIAGEDAYDHGWGQLNDAYTEVLASS